MASRGAFSDRFIKYWVKLKYIGLGEPPDRNYVGELLFQSQWITLQDIYSFISLPNRKEFEICFNTEKALHVFLELQSSNQHVWKDFEVFSPANLDVKTLVIKFWTGRISDYDVELYLKRFCDVLKPAVKPVDNFGMWYGIRKYQVKLRKDAEGKMMPIPNSVSFGPYNGKISYQGQASSCYVCQSTGHQAKECLETKCWKCGGFGHKAMECGNAATCTLCGDVGHIFFTCPKSYANKSKQKPSVPRHDNLQRAESGAATELSVDATVQMVSGQAQGAVTNPAKVVEKEKEASEHVQGKKLKEEAAQMETSEADGESSPDESSDSDSSSDLSESGDFSESSEEEKKGQSQKGNKAPDEYTEDQQMDIEKTLGKDPEVLKAENEKRKLNSSTETEGNAVKKKKKNQKKS